MTKKDFFIIIVKLFGLYTFIVTLFKVIPMSMSDIRFDFMDYFTLFSMIAIMLLFCSLTIYFLFHSHRIVTFLKLDKGFDDDLIVIGNLSSEKVASLGLIIVGGLLFIDNLPYFLSNAYIAFKSSVEKPMIAETIGFGSLEDYINLWSSLLSVLFGYLILTNYTWIVKKLFKEVNN